VEAAPAAANCIGRPMHREVRRLRAEKREPVGAFLTLGKQERIVRWSRAG